MQYLNEDVLITTFSYLLPEEIIAFYDSCKEFEILITHLSQHKGFVVTCTKIIADETVLWFEKRNIKLQLLKIYCSNIFQLQIWYQNGKLHRDNDLPAVITSGNQFWFQNGIKHRDNNLPAEIYKDGYQSWFRNGVLHRDDDLPAVVYPNGRQWWYQHGNFIKKKFN